jgi:hypothetical protein
MDTISTHWTLTFPRVAEGIHPLSYSKYWLKDHPPLPSSSGGSTSISTIRHTQEFHILKVSEIPVCHIHFYCPWEKYRSLVILISWMHFWKLYWIYLQNKQDVLRRNNRRVRVRVSLRLTVYRQSVRLRDKPLETHDQYFFANWTPAVIVLL